MLLQSAPGEQEEEEEKVCNTFCTNCILHGYLDSCAPSGLQHIYSGNQEEELQVLLVHIRIKMAPFTGCPIV